MVRYSIVIPHYNIPDLLVRCLNSIPNRDDIQVIVVDDFSDGCGSYLEKIPELSRGNVEFYITKDKKGAGHVRNVALPHIKGKKVLFADADDFFVEDFLQILDDYYDDDSDIIYFNTRGVFSNDLTKDSNRTKNRLFEQYQNSGNIDIFRYRYTEPWGKIYSAQLILDNEIAFDETVVANDQMFSVRTGIAAKKITAVNRPLYVVTVREGSLSYKSLDTKEKLMARIYVMARVQVLLEKNGYIHDEMMIFGHAVNLLRRYPLTFARKLPWLHGLGISVAKLLKMILTERILSPNKRQHKDLDKEAYIKV